jgi:aminoglycoside phosphotransferase (APT) family kinase protein
LGDVLLPKLKTKLFRHYIMSTPILASDIKITPDIVKTLLREQFNIYVQQLKLLGEGWDNCVYLINNNLVFRFPRRKEAILLVTREMTVLPAIKKYISLKIPEPKYFGKPSKIFNRPFYGHELIYGRSGCSVTLSSRKGGKVSSIRMTQFTRLFVTQDSSQVFDNYPSIPFLVIS